MRAAVRSSVTVSFVAIIEGEAAPENMGKFHSTFRNKQIYRAIILLQIWINYFVLVKEEQAVEIYRNCELE